MDATSTGIFVIVVVGAIIVGDVLARWWRENEWRRRWKDRDRDN